MFLLPGKTLGTQVSCTNHNKCQNTWLWLMCHGVWNFSTTIHTGWCSSATSYQLPHAHWTDVITHLNMKTQDTQPYTGAVNMTLVCSTDKINIFCGARKACELNELNWIEALRPVPWDELNELATDLIRQATWTGQTFLDDFELKLCHSGTTAHPGQASKHSQQSTPSLHSGNEPWGGG